MSNVMQRIANYFQNDYEGIDKTSPAFEVTVEELREIAGINTERCRLLAMERATYKPALQKLESIKQELINCENENEESGYCGDFEDFQLFHDNKLKLRMVIDMISIDEAIANERKTAEHYHKMYEFECSRYGKRTVDSGVKLECVQKYEYHSQIVELLQELKKRQEEDYRYMADIHEDIGYHKALDDLWEAYNKFSRFYGRENLKRYEVRELINQLSPNVLKVEMSQEDLLELKERMKNLPLTIVSTPEVESSIEFIDEQTIRNIAIDIAMERAAEAICIGCGYLKGTKCTYTGCNCGVSKPMLEQVMKALEQLKAGEE